MMIWTIQTTEKFENQKNRWPKKHKRELAAVMSNLEKVFLAFRDGAKIEAVRTFGFIHSEPAGVLAIDQKGGHGQGLKEVRLYVYPDTETKVLYVIILGDKKSQKADIKYCSDCVQSLKESEE